MKILFLIPKTSLRVLNLSTPLILGENDIKGLLNIIENIVPWYESVITALQLYMP